MEPACQLSQLHCPQLSDGLIFIDEGPAHLDGNPASSSSRSLIRWPSACSNHCDLEFGFLTVSYFFIVSLVFSSSELRSLIEGLSAPRFCGAANTYPIKNRDNSDLGASMMVLLVFEKECG